MPYVVEYTDEFETWFEGLTEAQQDAIDARVAALEREGPALGEPTVKLIKHGGLHHLKELRCSAGGALRILFAFDPRRCAILLLGGDKTGRWEAWYEYAIPQAEALYADYLQELRREGLL